MPLTPDYIELLERYFEGQLTPQEQQALEKEMATNEELRLEVEMHQLLNDGFAALELESFEKQVQSWEANAAAKAITQEKSSQTIIKNSPTPKIIVMLQKYWAAAALLAVVSSFAIWYSLGSPATPESLFAENFATEEVQPYVVLNRGGGDGDNTSAAAAEEGKLKVLLTSGVEAYNKKEYADAILYFEDYIKSASNANNEREIRFYMGISYLSQNNVTKAKEIFKDLSQQPFSIGFQPMKQSSEWYLALTLLKEGEVAAAKKRLNKIANEDVAHPYQKQAKTMLDKMAKHRIE